MIAIRQQHGYKIRGIEPPDLYQHDPSTRKRFWGWVVELGLKRKDKELSQGLDKDGKPLRPISAQTRKHRRSAMTPSGKGDPSAPPLTPGRQKSRTRSLLNGRAFSSHAEFFWRYDAFTGESWAVVLSYQAAHGRDVFGLSPAGLAWVKVQSWRKWDAFRAGIRQPAARQTVARATAVPRVGRYNRQYATAGMSLGTEGATTGNATTGRWTGGMTPSEWNAYFRQTASATLPGRPRNPRAQSEISGPGYNRILKATWNQGSGRGGSGTATPRPPRPGPRKPPTPKPTPVNRAFPKPSPPRSAPPRPPAPPKPKPPEPGKFTAVAQLEQWAKTTFPNASFNHENIPLANWNVLAEELADLAQTYPEVARRIQQINPGGIPWTSPFRNSRAVADVESGSIIAFNPNYWHKPISEVLKDRMAESASGYSPKLTTRPAATATHEWGHLIEAWLKHSNPAKLAELKALFQTAGAFDRAKAGIVSQYGGTKIEEAFAETFLAVRNQPESVKSDLVKRFREILTR